MWAVRRIVLLLALLPLALLWGCAAWPRPSDWKHCRFEVAALQFEGWQKNQTEWKLALAVHNPNPRPLHLEGLRLFALHDQDTLATLRSVKPLDLPPQDSARVELQVDLPDAAWKQVLATRGGPAHITVVGDAFFHTLFGVRKYAGALHKTYDVDLASVLNGFGGRLFENFLFSH